jgi:hypothetical protein
MGHLVDFSKLAELRAKTDRDLIRIVGAELDRAIVLAHLAGASQSVFHVRATATYTRVKALLEKMPSQNPKALAELEAKLKELRLGLELVPGALDHETNHDHKDHEEETMPLFRMYASGINKVSASGTISTRAGKCPAYSPST